MEQDHRFIKRLVNPGMGFGSFNTARRTLRGYEAMNMLRKGQVQGVKKQTLDISEKCPCLSLTAFQEAITRLQTQPVSTQKLGFEIVCVDNKAKLSICTS